MIEESTPTNGATTSPNAAGGAGCALDLTCEKDRALVRTQLSRYPKRWAGITDDVKDSIVDDLKWARKQARECPGTEFDPLAGAKVVISVARTLAMIEGQNQADDHHADKQANDDKRLVMDAVSLAAQLEADDLVRLAIKTGDVAMLPPSLQERAKALGA